MKVQFSMNFENERYGSDTYFIFSEVEDANLLSTTINPEVKMCEEFVNEMIQREEQTSKFLWEYYDLMILPLYSNLNKICTIQNISVFSPKTEE